MHFIVENIRSELISVSDEETRKSGERFFKEAVKIHGIKSAVVRNLSRKYYKSLASTNKDYIFTICEELLKTGYLEESFFACDWSYNVRKQFEPEDFKIFEGWITSYVSNWATCDTLCNHTVGSFVEMYPGYLSGLKQWAGSSNRWAKRASAVSLIIPARKGMFLNDIFEIADILHHDTDDMVQKGYGWMLKVASGSHQKEVFNYIMKKKSTMPRTSLRYAIEKMPQELKALAMAK
jgi:3-methyladenine DNA glycosylase AlkD